MIDFTLNDNAIEFTLNAETQSSDTDGITFGDTDILWGNTEITFDHA